jgi:pyrophosphatase PpaX
MPRNIFPLEVFAVLFDLDGTLLDTVPLIVASHRHTLSRVHDPADIPDDDYLRSTIGLPLEFVYDEKVYGAQASDLIREFQRYSVERTPYEVTVFRGVVPMLEQLKEKEIPLGVVTAKRRTQTMYTLELFDLLSYFDVVIAKEDTKKHKPDPAPLIEAAKRLHIDDLSRLLYVGDSTHDLECANRAGSYSAAVRWSLMPEDELSAKKPTFWLDRAELLPELLQPGQFAIISEEF